MLLKRDTMEKDDIFNSLNEVMFEGRKKFLITTLEHIALIKEDQLVKKIMSNQTLLHDMAYEMYEVMLNNDSKELERLLTCNLVTLEVNSNLIDVLLLLKTSSKSTLEEVKETVLQELKLDKDGKMEDIYDYIETKNKQDVLSSQKNYQKVLKMKGEKNE